jgi:hypothetical protein
MEFKSAKSSIELADYDDSLAQRTDELEGL